MSISSLILLPLHTLLILLSACLIEVEVLAARHSLAFHSSLPHSFPSKSFLSLSPPSLPPTTASFSIATGDNMFIYGVRSTAASSQPTVTTRLFLSSPSSGSGFGNKNNNSPSPKNNYTPSSASPSSSSSSPPATNELFELQELRAQLQTILKQNIPFQSLSNEKREELTKYVFAIIDRTESPINISGRDDGNTMGIAKFVVGIENKSWRMVFTTANNNNNNIGVSSLPTGATVILRVGEFLGMQGKLDYVLKYGERILGLNELVATSTCSIDVSVYHHVSP
jgi:hypothetical protein